MLVVLLSLLLSFQLKTAMHCIYRCIFGVGRLPVFSMSLGLILSKRNSKREGDQIILWKKQIFLKASQLECTERYSEKSERAASMAPYIQRAADRKKMRYKSRGRLSPTCWRTSTWSVLICWDGVMNAVLQSQIYSLAALPCCGSSGCSSFRLTLKDSHWLKPFSEHHNAFVEHNQRTWMCARARNRHDFSKHWVWKDRFCHIVWLQWPHVLERR